MSTLQLCQPLQLLWSQNCKLCKRKQDHPKIETVQVIRTPLGAKPFKAVANSPSTMQEIAVNLQQMSLLFPCPILTETLNSSPHSNKLHSFLKPPTSRSSWPKNYSSSSRRRPRWAANFSCKNTSGGAPKKRGKLKAWKETEIGKKTHRVRTMSIVLKRRRRRKTRMNIRWPPGALAESSISVKHTMGTQRAKRRTICRINTHRINSMQAWRKKRLITVSYKIDGICDQLTWNNRSFQTRNIIENAHKSYIDCKIIIDGKVLKYQEGLMTQIDLMNLFVENKGSRTEVWQMQRYFRTHTSTQKTTSHQFWWVCKLSSSQCINHLSIYIDRSQIEIAYYNFITVHFI